MVKVWFSRKADSVRRARRQAQRWTQARIATLQSHVRPLDDVDLNELWRAELECELNALCMIEELVNRVEKKLDEIEQQQERCRLLRTIPGVGPRLAEIVVAVLDDPKRFRTGKQVACYVGLTPRQYQSGDNDRQGRISRQGNSLLRAMCRSQLGQSTVQRVGADNLRTSSSRQPCSQENSHYRRRQTIAGAVLGHAVGRDHLESSSHRQSHRVIDDHPPTLAGTRHVDVSLMGTMTAR